MGIVSRGFGGRRSSRAVNLPPGQYLVGGLPGAVSGPTPRVNLASWTFTVRSETGEARQWNWTQFLALPHESITV